MARKDYVTLLLLLAGAAIGGYGIFTDSGPVGWLNVLQQRLFGSYWTILSFGLVVGAVMVAGGVLWDGIRRILGHSDDKVAAQVLFGPSASKPVPAHTALPGQTLFRRQAKVILLCGLVGIVLTWVVGSAIYQWHAKELKEDASAVYEAVDLAQGAPPHGGGAHLALRGIPVTEWVVTHRSGSSSSMTEDYRLHPMVGVGWKPADPIAVVVKLERNDVLPDPTGRPAGMLPRHPREVVLLARRSGSIPSPALSEFKKMGAQILDAAILVRPVPSQGGKPSIPDPDGSFQTLLVLCGGLSGIILLLTLAMCLGLLLQARKAARQAGLRP